MQNTSTMSNQTTTTAFIPDFRLEELEATISKLNKRCEKLGLPLISVTRTGKQETREFEWVSAGFIDGEFTERTRRSLVNAIEVTISGESPVLAGWEFAAKIETIEAGINIIKVSPKFEQTIPMGYRSCSKGCDHCNQERKRNETFVLFNASRNEFKQVGRSCIKDFLGHENIHFTADAASALYDWTKVFDLSGAFEGTDGGKVKPVFRVLDVLTIASSLVSAHGYISLEKARNSSSYLNTTGQDTLEALFAIDDPHQEEKVRAHAFSLLDSEESKQKASKVLDWALSLGRDNASQYLANIAALAECDAVSPKNIGLLASAIAAYHRDIEKKAEQENQPKKSNNFIGNIGEKIEARLKLMKLIGIKTEFGNSTIALFEDTDGNSVKWFTSSCIFCEEEIGSEFVCQFTIKDHKEYNGRNQTSVLRLRLAKEKKAKSKKAIAA